MKAFQSLWGHKLDCPPLVQQGQQRKEVWFEDKWSLEGWETAPLVPGHTLAAPDSVVKPQEARANPGDATGHPPGHAFPEERPPGSLCPAPTPPRGKASSVAGSLREGTGPKRPTQPLSPFQICLQQRGRQGPQASRPALRQHLGRALRPAPTSACGTVGRLRTSTGERPGV